MVMKRVESPEKELRFTRSRQAVVFWVLGSLFATAGITMLVTSAYRHINPDLPHPGWSLVPLLVSVGIFRWSFKLTRHAYLILTPLGLEIFPLWKPEKTMRVVFWAEMVAVEFNDAMTTMTVHQNEKKTAGFHISLNPIFAPQRALLAKVMKARLPHEEPAK